MNRTTDYEIRDTKYEIRNMLRAVIFDFDGVITDSEILHFRTFNLAIAEYNIEITKEDYYKNYLGLSDIDLLGDLVEKGLLKLDGQQIKEVANKKKLLFEQYMQKDGKTIDGVRDFLNLLEENNILMAICSGSLLPEIEIILQQAKLRSFFRTIVSAEHVRKGKPNPEGFLLALRRLNKISKTPISAGQCAVIEDSRWGLEAGKAAGMHLIAITNSYRADELKPSEKVIDNLKELTLEELKRICS